MLGEVRPAARSPAPIVVRAEQLADRDLDAQLLAALADQRVIFGLARLDLATGELPLARQLRRSAAARSRAPARRAAMAAATTTCTAMASLHRTPIHCRIASGTIDAPPRADVVGSGMHLATHPEANDTARERPARAPDRHAARPADPDGEGVHLTAGAGRAAGRHAGRFDASRRYDPDAFEQIFREPPALHRFPAAMAKRVQELARVLVDRFGGDAGQVWTGAAYRQRAGRADRHTARLRRAEGEDLRGAARQAVRRPARRAGARPPATTARTAARVRWPTSSTPPRWLRCARTRSR